MLHQASLDPGVQEGGRPLASPLPRFLCLNEWRPSADPLWQGILTEVAGVNLFGDPMLRIVNGSSRLELIGGVWMNVEREDAGLPSVRYQWDQRYPWLEEYWIVEEWTPVVVSREEWEASERSWEDGVSYLVHPLYPGARGEYRYYNHFRRKLAEGEDEPEAPTPTGLRFLAEVWRRQRAKHPPALLERTREEREKRMQDAIRRAKGRRAAREAEARKKKRDIWENEVGGPTGITPKVSLCGLDVPA